MNLFKNVGDFFRKAFSGSDNEYLRSIYRYVGFESPVWLPDSPETYVNNAYQSNPDVYAIVKLKSSVAASIPWCVYEVKDDKSLRKYKSLTSSVNTNIASTIINRTKALEEIEHSYLSKILHRANPNQSFSQLIENLVAFKMITGNGYMYGNGPDSKDIFTELWVMPSQYTIIHAQNPFKESDGGWDDEVSHYTLSFAPDTKIPKQKVLHTKYPNLDFSYPGSHLYGMSPIRAANRVVTISNDSYKAGAKLLHNMMPPGILVADDKDLPLTIEQAEKIRDRLIKAHSGVDNKRGDIPISPISMKWEQLGFSPVDLNIIESKKMTMRDFCNVYGVQSQLFNDPENKSYNNMQEARKSLIVNSVLPELFAIRDELNRWLVPAYEKLDGKKYYIDLDITSIPELQEDLERMSNILDKAWYLTGNEKRLAMNYDTDQDNSLMNDYLIPMNLVPISQYSSTSDIEKSLKELTEAEISDYES